MQRLPGVPQGGRRGDRHGGLLSTVSIVTTGHDVADARLHRTVGALQRAGLEVTIHGLGADASQAPSGCRVVVAPRGGMLTRLRRALIWPWQAPGEVVMTIDPDTSLAAWLATRVKRRAWVADVHEDYRALLKDRSWVPRPLLGVLRGAVAALNGLIARAELTLVADEHVPPLKARRRQVMRNEPEFSHLPGLPEEHTDGPWRAVYIGDNRTSRGLRTMVEAVAATAEDPEPWHLDIVGPVASSEQGWVDERTVRPDCRHITFHGRQAPAHSWQVAEGADLGLCLLANTPAYAEAMPSKVYEYAACGIPTLATPLPRVEELVSRTGAGAIVDGVEETTAALRSFATDERWRTQLRAAAREAGEVARNRPSTYDDAASRIRSLLG